MRFAFLLTLLVIGTALPVADAQEPDPESSLYVFAVGIDQSIITFEAGEKQKDVTITVKDASLDNSGTLTGQGGGVAVQEHRTKFTVTFAEEDDPFGWSIQPPPTIRTVGGETAEKTWYLKLEPKTIRDPVVTVTLNATHRAAGYEKYSEVTVTAISPGPDTYSAVPVGSLEVAPNEITNGYIRVSHQSLVPREFAFELTENTCNLQVGYERLRLLDGKGREDIPVTILGPDDKFWYNYDLCSLKFTVFPADQPNNIRTVALDPQLVGMQIDPVWIFNTVGVLLAAFIIFLLIARRKARIEEEILGRPQKPWLIPVEMVYLEHLKERDPQAHYVVRHFLMEEEYQSSLLWYNDFKKATRGSRAKERTVVAQEHKYERFQKKWQRRIAAPHKRADRLEAKLQKKLDRQGKAGARKERRNWKKLTKKLQAAHKKKLGKATKKWEGQVAKWEKQAARAQKKGAEVPAKPPKPEVPEPDYPAEPTGDRILLAQHKWNKKAVKARAKADKETGNLEVKFEKLDAKMLRKVRRKVLKIARKLDDPEFESEHPLLAGASEGSD